MLLSIFQCEAVQVWVEAIGLNRLHVIVLENVRLHYKSELAIVSSRTNSEISANLKPDSVTLHPAGRERVPTGMRQLVEAQHL